MSGLALAYLLNQEGRLAAETDTPPPGCSVGSTNFLAQDKGEAKGDVTINCSGLTENFGNRLTEVLNRILQNRLDPQMVQRALTRVSDRFDILVGEYRAITPVSATPADVVRLVEITRSLANVAIFDVP